MIRRPPRSTQSRSSAASDVYKRQALVYARECRAAAEAIKDPASSAQSHSLLGRSLHLMGDLQGASIELEASVHHWSHARRTTIYLAHELHYPSDVTLARNLWPQG